MKRIRIPLGQYTQLLSRYLKPQGPSIAALTVLLLASIGLQLVNPQIIRYFLDTAQGSAQGGTNGHNLLYAAGLFIGMSLLLQLLTVAATYFGENVGWVATNKLRGDVAAHCLKLDMSFHKSHTSGAVIERVDGDINSLSNFFSNFVITLLGNLVLIIGILVLLFRENWILGTGMAVFVVGAIWIIQYIRKFAIPYWAKMRQISSEFFGFLGEHLEGTEDTRANGSTGYVMHRFHTLLRRWLPIRIKAFFGWATMWTTTIAIFAFGNAIAFGLSAYLWKQGSLSIGTVYMIFYYTELMAKPIEKIRTQMEDLQKADASIVRVRELLDTKSAIEDGPGTPLPEGPLAVDFERVSFSYEPDSPTLNGLNFRVEPGMTVGLLGRTGSGKSTLARLLLRFYDPQEGRISLGGVPVRDATVTELRSKVGLVTQTIELFQASVRDNLTFFDPSISDERITDVLGDLGLGDWLRSLPNGLDAMIESGGGGLSAGEAQLLSFARVFLADPGLVILDEASSRLDPATERTIEAAIGKLLRGRTCIIIAHRLATVQRADRILILEDGHMLEYGERSQLAADKESRFALMMKTGMEELLV